MKYIWIQYEIICVQNYINYKFSANNVIQIIWIKVYDYLLYFDLYNFLWWFSNTQL